MGLFWGANRASDHASNRQNTAKAKHCISIPSDICQHLKLADPAGAKHQNINSTCPLTLFVPQNRSVQSERVGGTCCGERSPDRWDIWRKSPSRNYSVVQLHFTLDEVSYICSLRDLFLSVVWHLSINQHIKYFCLRCKIQLDLPVHLDFNFATFITWPNGLIIEWSA